MATNNKRIPDRGMSPVRQIQTPMFDDRAGRTRDESSNVPKNRDYWVKKVNSIRQPHVYGYQPGGAPLTEAQRAQYKKDVNEFNAQMRLVGPYLRKYKIGLNTKTYRYE